MPNPKKQVWLIKQPCYAVGKNQLHDGHLYHIARKAVDLEPPANNRCFFFSYFYCEGFASIEELSNA